MKVVLDVPPYFPSFLCKSWLTSTRLHAYNVYENELSEVSYPPQFTRPIFQDLVTNTSSDDLVETAQAAFNTLEMLVESSLTDIKQRLLPPVTQTLITIDQQSLNNICRYFVFLRFRNSTKYCEVLESLTTTTSNSARKNSVRQHLMTAYTRQFLQDIIAFLNNDSRKAGTTTLTILDHFQSAMSSYCWRFIDADISIGIAVDDHEFILPDSCYGTLAEGFHDSPQCSDLFFPVHPKISIYVLGKDKPSIFPMPCALNSSIQVGIESASDVHLRNAMILQTYPRYIYFSSVRSIALSVSSYDEFRWIPEHQDYSRLKQRCRQKFLQETVTKTLVVKGSVILTDLTDEITQLGHCPVGHGGFADVWKAAWHDPVEKRMRPVAVKVIRKVMIQNVQEKWMRRLHTEVIAWHSLCHRNVSQLFGVVKFHNSIGMVSLWCENGVMTHFLRGNKAVDRLAILIQIASGVAYLHSATPVVIHGDLKGGNILIDKFGCPIITDFGLSKVLEDLADSTLAITSSFFAGSTRWMAPELIQALIRDDLSPPITKPSDVYAFASMCLEVATDALPYPHRTNDHAVTVDILRGVKPGRAAYCLVQLRDQDTFWMTLDRCWNEAPDLRPTMKDLLPELEDLRLPA